MISFGLMGRGFYSTSGSRGALPEATRANVNAKDHPRAPKAVRRNAIWKRGGASSGGILEKATLPRLGGPLDG